jgi:hypothetical protein
VSKYITCGNVNYSHKCGHIVDVSGDVRHNSHCSARAFSHSTKDSLHDEWGFMTIDDVGNVTLMTSGNNGTSTRFTIGMSTHPGFTTYEVGTLGDKRLTLELRDIGRISFSRDLPVEAVSSRLNKLGDQMFAVASHVHSSRRHVHGASGGDAHGYTSRQGTAGTSACHIYEGRMSRQPDPVYGVTIHMWCNTNVHISHTCSCISLHCTGCLYIPVHARLHFADCITM